MNKIRKHLASYIYSMRGIRLAFRKDPNMTLHLLAAVAVVVVNVVLHVDRTDWILTLALTGLVWMAEMFNTSIEKLADRVTRQKDPLIGEVKDLASGAVLVICVTALICATIIYLPYLLT